MFGRNGAQERTRTSTPIRALAPEASASTSSATWAGVVGRQLQPGPRCCQRLVRTISAQFSGRSRIAAGLHRSRRGAAIAPCSAAPAQLRPGRYHEGGIHVETGDHLWRFGLRGALHRAAHGAQRLARSRGGAPPERGDLRAPLWRGGQVEPVFCNIRDDASVRAVMERRRCGGQLRGCAQRNRCEPLRRRAGRRCRAHRAHRRRSRVWSSWCISPPSGRTGTRPAVYAQHQGRGRGGRSGAFPPRGDPAPLGHLRSGGRLLQPLRRDGTGHADPAACRGQYALSARLCRRYRARGGDGYARARPSRASTNSAAPR
jgi:hypothetical protein